jgi:hypothetical protein
MSAIELPEVTSTVAVDETVKATTASVTPTATVSPTTFYVPLTCFFKTKEYVVENFLEIYSLFNFILCTIGFIIYLGYSAAAFKYIQDNPTTSVTYITRSNAP